MQAPGSRYEQYADISAWKLAVTPAYCSFSTIYVSDQTRDQRPRQRAHDNRLPLCSVLTTATQQQREMVVTPHAPLT